MAHKVPPPHNFTEAQVTCLTLQRQQPTTTIAYKIGVCNLSPRSSCRHEPNLNPDATWDSRKGRSQALEPTRHKGTPPNGVPQRRKPPDREFSRGERQSMPLHKSYLSKPIKRKHLGSGMHKHYWLIQPWRQEGEPQVAKT